MPIEQRNIDDGNVPKDVEQAVKDVHTVLNGLPFDTAISALYTVLGNAVHSVEDMYIKQQVILGTVQLAERLNNEVAAAMETECDTCEDREDCKSRPQNTEQ